MHCKEYIEMIDVKAMTSTKVRKKSAARIPGTVLEEFVSHTVPKKTLHS